MCVKRLIITIFVKQSRCIMVCVGCPLPHKQVRETSHLLHSDTDQVCRFKDSGWGDVACPSLFMTGLIFLCLFVLVFWN